MPRKDGVRGNSKKTDRWANENYRSAHPDQDFRGKGKKTAKRLKTKEEVVQEFPCETIHGRPPMFSEKKIVLMTTPFSKEEMEVGKQITQTAIASKKAKEKLIKQEDCDHGTCPLCGWSGPDGQGVYHEFDCPWVDEQMPVMNDDDERRYIMCTPWRGTETETVYPDGTRKPI